MNFNSEYRNEELIKKLVKEIEKTSRQPVRLMEVCGGHTMAIRRYGIQSILPSAIELISGPGCPVCVTSQEYVDKIIAYSKFKDTIVLTYGDLLRVPGSHSSLDTEKAKGADVRIIQSTIQAIEIARKYPDKKIVFAGIGFETTTPATAIAVLQARKEKLNNFIFLCAHKIMPPAMAALIEEGISIDGYIGPGHVCAITGSKLFVPLAEQFKIPVVISGFEPIDILQSILMLIKQVQEKRIGVEIQYRRLVSYEGNLKAQAIVKQVFETCDQNWRGMGNIPKSGLRFKDEFSKFDAEVQIPLRIEHCDEPKGCICGQVLKGISKPIECKLFGTICTPSYPVGACMVSSEGACNSYFSYRGIK
jgi:hydrogenase expression/formation protein HypD